MKGESTMSNNNAGLSAADAILTIILAIALVLLGAWLISDGLAASLEGGVSFGRTTEVLAGIILVFGTGRRA